MVKSNILKPEKKNERSSLSLASEMQVQLNIH